VAAQCPFLGMAGNRHQVFLVANPRHRCHLRGQPERIGADHQSAVCLTTAYRRCPRLLVDAPGSARPAWIGDQSAAPHGGQRSPAPSSPLATLRPGAAGPATRYTDLRVPAARQRGKPRHRWTVTELVVLGLGLAILLACSFIGYVVVYRLRVGPVVAAPLLSAEAPTLAPVEELPTLVPTFTPLPSPTLPLQIAEVEPPTPIPEPTLLPPTPVRRPPATSPPTRLVIPKIGIDIPVLPVGSKTVTMRGTRRVVWDDVPNAAGFHQGSAYPGNPGNTVINGHRDIQGAVFRHLDWVTVGDEIVVYVGEVAYHYTVTETLVVPEVFASSAQRAENLKLIGYMPEERLTLITCTPIALATHRLLVIAKPTDEGAQ
jgi:LPXTG-site transpeptidase (sortase) family protein